MSSWSLRSRFTIAMLAWVGLGLLAVGLSASALFRSHVEQVFHAELEEHLVELIGLTEIDASGRPRLARPLSDPRYGAQNSGYYWQVDGAGAPLRSPSLGSQSLDPEVAHSEGVLHVRAPGPHGLAMLYGMTRPAQAGGAPLHYVIGTDIRHLDALVADFRRDLIAWLVALALALLVGAALALRFATRPLDRLGAAIADVHAGAAQRMGTPWPSDVAPLAADLDRLLDAREAMVAAARIEAGNLAHGLRTSLAVLTDEAENLVDQPAGATLLAECRRIARQLDWHLARARSATSAAAAHGPARTTHLPAALAPLLSAMARLHQRRGITFTADGPTASLAIDPEALAEILSNLLDNAGKWAGTTVGVHWQAEAGTVTLTITDDGPGIAADALERLFVPGARLDEQVPGHGLGLAIARDLADAANASLDLLPRPDGQPGTVARLIIKAA